MKTTLFLLAGMVCLIAGHANAQEYKLSKSTGTLLLREVNHVTIEGNSGSEIIFNATPEDHDGERDQRSKGLRAISNSGLEDNTGLGLSVVDNAGVVEVHQLKKMDGPELRISVPKGVTIRYEHSSPYGEDVTFKNIEGKIEVSTVHNGVHLDNATGVVEVKTVHGEIEASFPATMKNSIELESVHGPVDVTFPIGIKANIKASTRFGEILVDPDFKIEIDRTGGMVKYNDGVTGKIGGGGIDVVLSATHNNVYLRKK